jgi:hypothetical protein
VGGRFRSVPDLTPSKSKTARSPPRHRNPDHIKAKLYAAFDIQILYRA